MKICAECQSPAPDGLLACAACGCGIFTEPDTPGAEKRVDSGLTVLLKWAVGYLLSAVLIGMVTTLFARMLLRNDFRAAAEGMATAPIMLVPLLTMVVFARYASRYQNPLAWAGALYLAVSALGFAVHLVVYESHAGYIFIAANTLVFALIGTAFAVFFRRKNP